MTTIVPSSTSADNTSVTGQLARRFPLVPRPRPVPNPVQEQLAEIITLARTPPEHPDASTRIAAAHNRAALLASDHGHTDLAEALCRAHHDRYTNQRPWDTAVARLALEPVINLARLRIRAHHTDSAVAMLNSLLSAVNGGPPADLDGATLDLHGAFATPADRARTRRWIWTVTLADGIRALTRAGRLDDALVHARRHHGIGDTLLDGRQIAILAAALNGDPTTAHQLLDTTVLAEPWQQAVAAVLRLLIHHHTTGTASDTAPPPDLRHADPTDPTTITFAVETHLAAAALLNGPARHTVIDTLRSTTPAATLTRILQSHPARRLLAETTHIQTAHTTDHDQPSSRLPDALNAALRATNQNQ